uniref:DNA recombination and repair protein Rad51-like C-terminal domain-containing protein n=1 Tax=Thermofilum pendens TaxID=2269 RepID=A0A7C4FCZ3_THEPE
MPHTRRSELGTWRSFLGLIKQPGLKALYGPPLSFKTSLVLTCLETQKGKAAYIGLGKHALSRHADSNIDTFQALNFREAVNLLLDFMVERQREWKIIAYDGFGSECIPLYCGMKERSVMQAALFIASALRFIATKLSASVVVVTTETYKGKPLFYSVLSKRVESFVRISREEDFIRASILTPQLLEEHAYLIPLDFIQRRRGG